MRKASCTAFPQSSSPNRQVRPPRRPVVASGWISTRYVDLYTAPSISPKADFTVRPRDPYVGPPLRSAARTHFSSHPHPGHVLHPPAPLPLPHRLPSSLPRFPPVLRRHDGGVRARHGRNAGRRRWPAGSPPHRPSTPSPHYVAAACRPPAPPPRQHTATSPSTNLPRAVLAVAPVGAATADKGADPPHRPRHTPRCPSGGRPSCPCTRRTA